MKYKDFFKDLLVEGYPNGGFDMSRSEADILNTNRKRPVDETGPCWDGYVQLGMKRKNGKSVPNCIPAADENIFKAMALSKHHAKTPLSRPKEAPAPPPVVRQAKKTPATPVHVVDPVSDDEFEELMRQYDTRRQAKEGIGKSIKDFGRIEMAKMWKEPGESQELVRKLKALRLIRDKQKAASQTPEPVKEATFRGKKVTLNKPMRGDVKKSKVFVKDPTTGNVKKVNFGDKTMRIKKSNPARRKSFRARHNCDNPGPKTKARYWACRSW